MSEYHRGRVAAVLPSRGLPTRSSPGAHRLSDAAGFNVCCPVTSGASVSLYEVINTFTKGVDPDFSGTLPAFRLDPGIVSDLLAMDGAPVYAHGSGKTRTTSGVPPRSALEGGWGEDYFLARREGK